MAGLSYSYKNKKGDLVRTTAPISRAAQQLLGWSVVRRSQTKPKRSGN